MMSETHMIYCQNKAKKVDHVCEKIDLKIDIIVFNNSNSILPNVF